MRIADDDIDLSVNGFWYESMNVLFFGIVASGWTSISSLNVVPSDFRR